MFRQGFPILLRALVCVGLIVFSHSPQLVFAESPGLKIVTSVLPARCLAANIAGSLAEVDSIVPAGSDPHDFAFSHKDLKRLNDADLIILVGLELEGWLTKPLKAGGPALASKIIYLGEPLGPSLIRGSTPLIHSSSESHSHDSGLNPHFWLDPVLMQQAVTNLTQVLIRKQPANREVFLRNSSAYLEKLALLDADLRKMLLPVKKIPFITLHDAFPYFARRYDLQLAGVVEELPDVKPSPKYLGDLYKVVRKFQVRAIFREPHMSSRLVEQIAADLKLKVGSLDPLESGDFAVDAYENGMRKNAETLFRVLK